MDQIIQVKGLRKSYGSVEAVKDIDFNVDTGTLFAFLGPNGAGKSTTIDMIATLLKPDKGTIEIDGHFVGKEDDTIRGLIGIVFQDSLLDKLLTVRENLRTRGAFYGLSGSELKTATERAINATGISEFIDRPYGKLSGGQKRRSDIARALINTPKVLFLDEPTTGLDPQTRQSVWETITDLQKEHGMTVFLTTHYMEEAANADHVVIIDHGEILAQGTPVSLKDRYSSDILKLLPKDKNELEELLKEHGLSYTIANQIYRIPLMHTTDAIDLIEECRDNLTNIELLNGTMDDVFINITGREIRES